MLATGEPEPFGYQERLAEEPWPDLLEIPTGMGKTAGVTLAWAWKRGWRVGKREPHDPDPNTPRRLIWCLPMRVLVEQTRKALEQWFGTDGLQILGKAGNDGVSVHVLMGGKSDLKTWAEYPERDMVLIGTQDMLLSRALMRGYGMSRFLWPVHFAFLHNDCLWAFDEIQLMGAGLTTSAQIDAFRRDLTPGAPSRSLWLSATLRRDWLETVDFRSTLETARHFRLSPQEQTSPQVAERYRAIKHLHRARTSLTKDSAKSKADQYAKALADEVLEQHAAGTQTLVVVNTVERAQTLYQALEKHKPEADLLLVHARFRRKERDVLTEKLKPESDQDRIVVATQAIEAGVNISSRTLFTELAPWSSLVQRFGRCNRRGEYAVEGADVFWIDVEEDLAVPYQGQSTGEARQILTDLSSASPAHLRPPTEDSPVTAVLRRRDFLDLFNTDPDLSGFDVDIAPYIRDGDDPDVQIFWRNLADDSTDQPHPSAREICRASLGQFKSYLDKRKKGETIAAYRWDALLGRWQPMRERPHPGMILMLDAKLGGYDEALGFAPDRTQPVEQVPRSETPTDKAQTDAFQGEHLSLNRIPVTLADHLGEVEREATELTDSLGLSDEDKRRVKLAARWHDVGKSHPAFQSMLLYAMGDDAGRWGDTLLAKGSGSGRPYYAVCDAERKIHERRYFRHELASMLAWLDQMGGEEDADLIAYLIAAHHGKVRTSLRALPNEQAPPQPGRRYARGVWEEDELPELEVNGQRIAGTRLDLGLMELGEGPTGPSWSERIGRLLDTHGPFKLAWLEALVRIADWRASRQPLEISAPPKRNSAEEEQNHG
nr:CRISPR-associated helicase Cas3' [Candidatus Thiosymbion oneisti]